MQDATFVNRPEDQPREIPTPIPTTRLRAGVVALAPAALLAAHAYHPYLPGRQPNVEALAEAVLADPMRWGLSHLAVGVASGLLVLAFLAVRGYLRAAGEERWSAAALPFVVLGGTLYVLLPGMEFAPLGAAETGADVRAAQSALQPWFVPVLVSAALLFALGVLGFARAIARSGVLTRRQSGLVVAALVVMAVARFVPLAAVQLYVQGAAGVAALWPLAYRMRKGLDRGTARPGSAARHAGSRPYGTAHG